MVQALSRVGLPSAASAEGAAGSIDDRSRCCLAFPFGRTVCLMSSNARVAAVTGAAQGIGRRTAEVLADRGYALALIDLRESTETVGAVHERGRDALDVPGDVSVEADVAAFSEQVRERFGRVDVLVNNAGISLITPAEHTAAEWGGRGVRVNAICPGWVKTEMDVADQAAGGYVDTDIVEQVPMGRFAAPDDIAETIAFLADPVASGFVNGVTLPIDGGWTADASWTSLRLRKR